MRVHQAGEDSIQVSCVARGGKGTLTKENTGIASTGGGKVFFTMDGNRSDDQVASSDPACPQQSCRLVLDGRSRWALTSCAHCRDYKHSACVLSCYGKVAHHREVVLVNDAGARESIGLLSEGQGPPPTGVLGRRVVLDQAAIDDGVICIVSCPSCAGQPLGSCMDAGHEQQVSEIIS